MNNELHSALFPYREYWWARYDAGVRQIDQYLGELQTDLDTLGVWEEAYVIITADHGEALGEHGIWTHGLSAHQDQLHVPLILRWPGKLAAGRRLAQSVSMFDLHATILEQVGLAASGDAQCASLVDLLSGESHESHVALGEAVKHNAGQLALVQGKWKLFVDRGNDVVQLFDLDADPHERDDVSAQNPDVVARLSALLDERLKENAARAAGAGASRSAATPEEMERLRGLGYVGESTEETDDGGG
jgi:arylsulfatase A-like enzyme